jgi:hypothetical protein
VFILDVPAGTPEDSESCLRRAEKWGHPQIENFEIADKEVDHLIFMSLDFKDTTFRCGKEPMPIYSKVLLPH